MVSAVGESPARTDALDKVTGRAIYARDQTMSGMLYMKLVYAGVPHANLRAIDVSKAQRAEGVILVLTSKDVPVNRYGIIVADRPVLCSEKVRHAGDQIAAVVAETPEEAAYAASLVEVTLEPLPVLDTPEAAMSEDAPPIHERYPHNLAHSYYMKTGDVDAALAQADVVVSHEYRTPMQEHAMLEAEAGVGYIDEADRVTLITAGQSIYDDQRQIASVLDIPADQVRVIYGPIGGSFGAREDLTMQTVLALAVWRLRRPVKLAWDRAESVRGHAKRHAMILRYTWGARRDGTLLAAKMQIVSDAGAYSLSSSSVLDNFRFAAMGPYHVPVVELDARAVYTNNVPGGAFRGFGFPQVAFAAELQIELLAEALGIDPITMRMRNCLRDDSFLTTGSPVVGGTSLTELIQSCAEKIGAARTHTGWRLPAPSSPGNHKRRGFGLAIGMKNAGFSFGFPEGSEARVVLEGGATIEHVRLYTAAADVGQGAHSVLVQICGEALQVPLEAIEIVTSDTSVTGDSGPASASRLTVFAGNAVLKAAEMAMQDWRNESRPAVGVCHWDAPKTTAPDPITGACLNSVSFMYGAQAVEVDVDTETGQVSVNRVVAVHDPGRAISPGQVAGQVEGAVSQALGWSLLENFVTEGGQIRTDQLSTYLIPTVLDIAPNLEVVLIDKPDPVGPYGARGIGEIPFIPLAPAITSAVHHATGVWFSRIPLTPEVVLNGLMEHRSEGVAKPRP